jgi:hypothetical protein
LDSVKEGIGAGKAANRFHIGIQSEAGNSLRSWLARKSTDFYVAEGMESEGGDINFFPIPSADKYILLNRNFWGPWSSDRATVAVKSLDLSTNTGHGIEGSIRVEELSITQFYLGPPQGLHLQPDPSGEILTEVHDKNPRERL